MRWARLASLRHIMIETKQKVRTLMPMNPTKMGGDEDEEGGEVEGVADADAAAELLGEGDVEDMVDDGSPKAIDENQTKNIMHCATEDPSKRLIKISRFELRPHQVTQSLHWDPCWDRTNRLAFVKHTVVC